MYLCSLEGLILSTCQDFNVTKTLQDSISWNTQQTIFLDSITPYDCCLQRWCSSQTLESEIIEEKNKEKRIYFENCSRFISHWIRPFLSKQLLYQMFWTEKEEDRRRRLSITIFYVVSRFIVSLIRKTRTFCFQCSSFYFGLRTWRLAIITRCINRG